MSELSSEPTIVGWGTSVPGGSTSNALKEVIIIKNTVKKHFTNMERDVVNIVSNIGHGRPQTVF